MKLLVLVLRGLQTAMLGPYGNRWVDTPNFDILAASGTVFDWHFSTHPNDAHRVWRDGRHAFAPPGPDLVNALRAAGLPARLLLDSSRGVPPGWEAETCNGMEATLARGRKAIKALTSGLLWVEFASLLPPWQIAGQFLDPIFAAPVPVEEDEDEEDEEDEADAEEEVGIELLPEEEPIEPILAPQAGPIDPADDRLFLSLQSTYAAAVAQLDAVIGELLDGLPDDVTLIVTSDAGLPLGEHGRVGAAETRLYEERAHVPLLMLGPGCRPSSRVQELTCSLDLAPTIAAFFGVALPEAHGLSLLPLLKGERLEGRDALLLTTDGEAGLRTPEWYLRVVGPERLLGTGTAEGEAPTEQPAVATTPPVLALYEKPHDRLELNDLSQPNFARAEEMAAALRERLAAAQAGGKNPSSAS